MRYDTLGRVGWMGGWLVGRKGGVGGGWVGDRGGGVSRGKD